MSFRHKPRHTPRPVPWFCSQCGLRATGDKCRNCEAVRIVTTAEAEITAQKAHEAHLRKDVNPRTWAFLEQLEALAMDHADAGIRDRAGTWLCAVIVAAESGQEMCPEEVDHVLAQVGVAVHAKAS